MKRFLTMVLAMALIASSFGSAPAAEAAKKAPKTKKITLSAKKKTLKAGAKFTLKVKSAKPKKASKAVTWKSNKKKIATVSKKGVVKALKAGKATITATSKKNKKAKAKCVVTVRGAKPTPNPTTAPTKPPTQKPEPTPNITLPDDSMKGSTDIKMGTVINPTKIASANFTALAKQQFDMVTFENEMKGYSLLDVEASQKSTDGMPVCKFGQADSMMDWAKKNGFEVRGHVLIWESSTSQQFFHEGYDTSKPPVTRETLLARMDSYVMQVISHFNQKYPGMVTAWDVVNEAILPVEDGGTMNAEVGLPIRTGNYYNILGPHYIKDAFKCARKAVNAVNKDIKLFYNDYNTFEAKKRGPLVNLIKYLNADGEEKLLDCMGMEGYVLYTWPASLNDVKLSMEAFQGAGVQVGITELTVRLNPHLANGKSYPYSDILTPTQVVSQMAINTHANRYRDLIKIYKDFDKAYPGSLTGISIWGLFDRPDMEIEKTKPIDVPVAEGGRHYDYDVYGTHSGLFVGDFNKNYDDFKIKQAFTNVITELKK